MKSNENTSLPSPGQVALEQLRQRAAEHETSMNEEYQEYAAGLRDAVKALEQFVK